MDHPRPWLRYVDADDLESSTLKFDDLSVESSAGEKLGKVDGFVVDEGSGRPYYVAVNAGGWFKSKLFLLPVGHIALDGGRSRLIADVTKERVNRFPGFDRDEFEKLSDDDLARMDEQIIASCCPTEVVNRPLGRTRFDTWSHYKSPGWWDSDFYRPDRIDRAMRDMAHVSSSPASPSSERAADARSDMARNRDRELVIHPGARDADVNAQSGVRAQPGDLLGVETGGESTHVGDTAKDEDQRRLDAERDASKLRRD